ncbi:uncharacterized protein K452DRAFT_283239, partial [Aplosporella prunicola CBS 121167]
MHAKQRKAKQSKAKQSKAKQATLLAHTQNCHTHATHRHRHNHNHSRHTHASNKPFPPLSDPSDRFIALALPSLNPSFSHVSTPTHPPHRRRDNGHPCGEWGCVVYGTLRYVPP